MAEKRKIKKRKEDSAIPNIDESTKPSKEEYAIAKWLKNNIPHKKTKFANYSVQYFTGVKAVDALLESKWGIPSKDDDEPFFKSRADVVNFLDLMLNHKFFHRAKKVVVSEQELKARHKKKEKKKDDDEKEKDKDKDKKRNRDAEEAESSHAEGAKDDSKGTKEVKELKKRKIRLEMHMDQSFADGLDAYVWIYDPIPLYYWICGTMIVLGAIGICVFPLWPPTVRKAVWYLSVGAVGFLFMILGLVLLRLLVFCLIWVLTFGKHHLWLFPNLLEDVGFFASFWPVYQYEYLGDGSRSPSKKERNKKKYKDSDNEDERGEEDEGNEAYDAEKTDPETGADTDRRNSDTGTKNGENTSESESESSQKSQTGRDFEMVEKEDAQEVQEAQEAQESAS